MLLRFIHAIWYIVVYLFAFLRNISLNGYTIIYSFSHWGTFGLFEGFGYNDYAKAFDCVDYNKLWKILQEMGIPDHLTCLLRNYMQVRKQQLELDMEQQIGPNRKRSMSRLCIVTLLI